MSYIPIILASSSPARLELLKRIKIIPDYVIPANINETPKKKELPAKLAIRLAREKAEIVAEKIEDGIIIAADSVVTKGLKVLPKASTKEEIRYCLEALSGCRHRVYTGVCIIKKIDRQTISRQRLVQTTVKFKRLTHKEIEFYVELGEGLQKGGGYSISGYVEGFISFISGSISNVIGLPLFDTLNMLSSLGYSPMSQNIRHNEKSDPSPCI